MKISFKKAAATPQSAPHAVLQIQRSFGDQQQLRNREHGDGWIFMSNVKGWTLKNNVMGCQAEICVERVIQSTVRTGQNRSRPRLKILSTTLTQCKKTTGRTDELRYLPFSSSWCPFVCSGSSGSPGSQDSFVVLLRIRGFY